jgi:hypothetical protein
MQALLSNDFESAAVCLLSNDYLDCAFGCNTLLMLLKSEGIDVEPGRKVIRLRLPEYAFPFG